MKVRITKRHIAEGMRSNARHCPIALALNDRFGGRSCIGGDVTVAEVTHTLTNAATGFIRDFDAGRPVSPGWLTVWE